MLRVNYLTSIDRWFFALCFQDIFKVSSTSAKAESLRTDNHRYFWVHFRKLCFQKSDLLYEKFVIVLLDAEFNSEQNGVTVKSDNEKISVISK